MKNAKNIGMFAVVAFAIGMVGINFSDGTFALQSNMSSTYDEGASLQGHLEIIHKDSEGKILSYQQTDNGIMNEGRDCVARALFGGSGNNDCTDTTPGGYTFIALSNGTLMATGDTSATGLLGTEITDCGLSRADASSVVETNSAQGTGGDDPVAITTISNTFTWICTTGEVKSAALFNATQGAEDNVFAAKDFPSAIGMALNDQLTVNWAITIDGSNAMN